MIATYTFIDLLEKMSNSDKDIRFMATNDMLAELQKDTFKLDDENERKLVLSILKILSDNSGEVQNLGVKCITKLLARCRDSSAEKIVDRLCQDLIASSTEERIRDISSLGLKAASQALGSNSGIARLVAQRLINSLTVISNTVSVLLDVLDITSDIILKQGHNLSSLHQTALEKFYPLLEHERQAVRKGTIHAIHKLSHSASSKIQSEILTKVTNSIMREKSLRPELKRTLLQTLAALVTNRSSSAISPVVDLICYFCQSENNELRESAIATVEAILRKSPQSFQNIDKLLLILNESIQYDPNYCGDIDDEDDLEYSDDEDDDYSDDEDMSWMVRRACAKCFDAVVLSPYGNDKDIVSKLGRTLLNRFKEREESVINQILNTFNNLIKISGTMLPNIIDEETMTNQCIRLLKSKKGRIVQNVVLNLISAVEACPTFFSNSYDKILPLLHDLMTNTTETSIRLDIINFFLVISKRVTEQTVIQKCSESILPILEGSINDSFYKIVSEALRVVSILIEKDAKPYEKTCQAALQKLKVSDMDQEVKDAAILCVGVLLSKGAYQESDAKFALEILIQRISNEMTRLAAVKALQAALLDPTLAKIIPQLITPKLSTVASFLRKNQRILRVLSLNLLATLIENGLRECDDVLEELPQLINQQDLHIAQLAMQLAILALEAKIPTNNKITEKVIALVQSPLLQGASLKTLLKYFNTFVKMYPNKYKETARALTERRIYSGEAEHRNEIHNIAKCLAELSYSWSGDRGVASIQPVLEQMITDSEHSELEKVKQFSLLTLGELGRRIPLGSKVIQQQISQLKTQSEDIKVSAAIGLGLTAAGNINQVLPILLNNLKLDESQGNYLTLIAIRQAVVDCPVKELEDIANDFYVELQKFSGAPEEGTRNVLSECLGRTVVAKPSLCAKLQQSCLSSDHRVRQTQLATAKYACHLDELDLKPFLSLLSDKHHLVRRAAIAFVNSCAHNSPKKLCKHIKGTAINALYKETQVKPELIREVMMGPFKHKIDDGLEIRKATFECLYSLLDTCHSEIDLEEFLQSVEAGFKDDYDVKILAFLILYRVVLTSPTIIGSNIERFTDHFKTVLTHRVNPKSVKQEYEKADELKRSVLRIFSLILSNQNDFDLDQKGQRVVSDLYRSIETNADLNALMNAVCNETSTKSRRTKQAEVTESSSGNMEWME